MARVVKEDEYAVKRNEILSVAQRLVITTGFEQMSVQDILHELKISKGAFYHYFDSKLALLDGLVDRMMDEAEQVLQPIVDAKNLPALEKLRRYFDASGRWKTSQSVYARSAAGLVYRFQRDRAHQAGNRCIQADRPQAGGDHPPGHC